MFDRASLSQIAQVVGLNVNTLKSWVSRGWVPLDQEGDEPAQRAGETAYVGPITQARIIKIANLTRAGVTIETASKLVCDDPDGEHRAALELAIGGIGMRYGRPIAFAAASDWTPIPFVIGDQMPGAVA